MESLKPKGAKLNLFDRDWYLLFTTTVIDELQDHFDININADGIPLMAKDKTEDKDFMSNLSYFVMALINEQIEIANETEEKEIPLYTLRQVKRRVTNANWIECWAAVLSAWSLSWMTKGEDEEETTPK